MYHLSVILFAGCRIPLQNHIEKQNIIILCFGIELTCKNITSIHETKSSDNPFKFIASTLYIKDKTIYVIILASKSHSIIPIIHKHQCIEKIYLYGSEDIDLAPSSSSIFEKISGCFADINVICDQIINDIKVMVERPLRWDRSFNLFTMLYTQQLENQYSVIKGLSNIAYNEFIVIFHCDSRRLFRVEQKSIPVVEFTDANECIRKINEIPQSQIFLVISGNIIPSEMQPVFDLQQIHAVYIFRTNQIKYPINKRKVSGLFYELQELSQQLYKDIVFYREEHIHTSRIDVFSTIEHTESVISQLNDKHVAFLTYNLFIDILPQVPLLEFKQETLIKISKTLFPNAGEEILCYLQEVTCRRRRNEKYYSRSEIFTNRFETSSPK